MMDCKSRVLLSNNGEPGSLTACVLFVPNGEPFLCIPVTP